MYVITQQHETYTEVLLGPIDWKPRYIAAMIQQDLDLDTLPNISVADEDRIPYNITDTVRVRRVEQVFADINPKLQKLDGPFWSYTDELATATYTAVDKSIDEVKGELRPQAAAKRYQLEHEGVEVLLQDKVVPVSTARQDRSIYTSAVPGPWKFSNGEWLTLSQEDLNTIISAVQTKVSGAFEWEQTKLTEINNCTTLAELDAIGI
jgi:hypothetical protein